MNERPFLISEGNFCTSDLNENETQNEGNYNF